MVLGGRMEMLLSRLECESWMSCWMKFSILEKYARMIMVYFFKLLPKTSRGQLVNPNSQIF